MRMELRALAPVSEGEEVTISYVDFLKLSADRQKQLEERFHFQCSCERCSSSSSSSSDHLMAAAAETNPPADKVKEVTAFSQEHLEKIEKALSVGDHSQVLKLCEECLEKQEDVLADTHLSRLQVLSVASQVLSHLKRFPEAAELALKMVEGYRKLYHPNNAQLGMALMRAGVTLWHAGGVEVGHNLICKAYRILMVTHGPNHSVTKDLESMRSQTETELKILKEKEFHLKEMTSSSSAHQNLKGFLRKQ